MSVDLSAPEFVKRLKTHASPEQRAKYEATLKSSAADEFFGVRMGLVFALAKEFIDLPVDEIEALLDSSVHEVRAGALSIMDKAARRKQTPDAERRALYDLYMGRIDRIDNWDLVDLGCPYVVGSYLYDKPRAVLYALARSNNTWERRTAIVSTLYFVRQGDVADTFTIAELLLGDGEDLIHKATGGLLREAGKKDRQRLLTFLDAHAAVMPRVALRYAIEHLDPAQRDHYLSLRAAAKRSSASVSKGARRAKFT